MSSRPSSLRRTQKNSYVKNAHDLITHLQSQAWVIIRRGLGILFMCLGLALAFACLTYRMDDPSLNTGTIGPAHNLIGETGARWADFFLQNIGLGVLPLIILMCTTGRAMSKDDDIPLRPAYLISYGIIAILATAIGFARLPSFGFVPQPYLGGAIGMMMLNSIAAGTQPLLGPWIHIVLSLFFFILAFIMTALGIGLTLRGAAARLLAGVLIIFDSIRFVALFSYTKIQALRDPSYHLNPDIIKPIRQRAKKQLALENDASEDDTTDEDDDDTPDASYPRRAANDIKVVRPETARPKQKKSTPKQMDLVAITPDEFDLPALELLQEAPLPIEADKIDEGSLRKNAEMLQGVLGDYNVRGDIVSIHPGPVVTLYELEPAPGTKSSRVIGLANDIARSMSAVSVRAAVVPGRNAIGVEIPNKKRQTVYLRELLTSDTYANTNAKLALVLGKDIGGHPIIADLARMPHLLVAGTTGSGKSVAVNTMILSLLYRLTPAQCRFIMIDPKMLELSMYDDIPHLLSPVVTEPAKAIVALKWAVNEMENRYRAMSKLGVRNIEGYNARLSDARRTGEVLMRKIQTGFDPETGQAVYEEQPLDLTELPYIVIIVDEFADLMLVAGKDVENAIQRLAQMARAAGIHLIMATQRPSVDVITGVIKANFPTRISFQVTSKIDSRTILGDGGAEQLLGMGDMLYMAAGGRVTRVHGPFVSDGEVEQVVEHLKAQGTPQYLDDVTDEDGTGFGGLFGAENEAEGSEVDDMYDQAVALVSREGKASTSFVQRHLQIGYNRAARIIEEMEKQGIISTPSHAGKREVLVGDHSGRH